MFTGYFHEKRILKFRQFSQIFLPKMTLTAKEDDDQFGRKMYLVLCLQRGLLQEALKTAQKVSESEPNHPTVKELIR